MNENNLIKREDVVSLLDAIVAKYNKALIAELGDGEVPMSAEDLASIVTDIVLIILATVKAIPSASQEMSAVEYLKARERMCAERLSNNYGCNGCPMLKHKGYDCETIEDSKPNEAVTIVEQWAKDHLEEFCSRGERREAE